jgi:DNA-binding winged helix-turn-helix (wHTH) protein
MQRLHFGEFEFDIETGELRKNDTRIRLQDQPAKLLALLATHPGQLVTRTDIQKALWGENQFVEFEHAINTAIKKVREALEEDPENPRLIETLPRKGYRFIAPVELPSLAKEGNFVPAEFTLSLPAKVSRTLFLLIQAGYIAIYCAALYYHDALDDPLQRVGFTPVWLPSLIIMAMCGIALRLYLLSAIGWAHPAAGRRFRSLFPALLLFDGLWAASPLLATQAIGVGVALAGVAGLAYVPFAQRTLIDSIYPAPPSRT